MDGQSLGKFPAEHTNLPIFESLFGNQRLLIYSSSLHGMMYMLPFPMEDHQIHFGYRDGNLVVQARLRDSIFEYIPAGIFGNSDNFDLPGSLVANCVHWLNLDTGIMEVRRRPDI